MDKEKLAPADESINMFFKELLKVSWQQLNLLNNTPLDKDISAELLSFTEQRKAVMEKIEQLKTSGIYSENKLDDQTIDIIKTIQEIDTECQNLIKNRLNNVADKIKATREHKKAHHAYTADVSYNGGWFYDGKK